MAGVVALRTVNLCPGHGIHLAQDTVWLIVQSVVPSLYLVNFVVHTSLGLLHFCALHLVVPVPAVGEVDESSSGKRRKDAVSNLTGF